MQLFSIPAGFLKLDGGAMFGIVPRRMWSKLNPPDENNMCTWAMRNLLVQTGKRNILIDTGVGNKQDDKFRAHFEPSGEGMLFDSLQKSGFDRTDITDVFLTHLHFDHCGGALWRNDAGEIEPAFPNAVYWTNKTHFDWAMNPNMREKASFLKENFLPLYQSGRLQFLPENHISELAPGFSYRLYYGHTEAMMAPILNTPTATVIYCADSLPSQWHIGMPYVMAYDIRPLVSLQEKAQILEDAAENGHILMFEHDPIAECARVKKSEDGKIVLHQTGSLKELLGH